MTKIIDEIKNRFSPMIFSDQQIANEDLYSLFEAARWAPSSFNSQPWRFIYAKRTDTEEFNNLLSCLNDYNTIWAQTCSVLVLIATKINFELDGKTDELSLYSTGMAVGNLLAQATSHGILAHQMGGYSRETAARVTLLPKDYMPVAMMALGYLGDISKLNDDMRKRAEQPRTRFDFDKIVMKGEWKL